MAAESDRIVLLSFDSALEPEPVRSTRPLIMVADYTETPGPVFRLTRFQSPRLWTVDKSTEPVDDNEDEDVVSEPTSVPGCAREADDLKEGSDGGLDCAALLVREKNRDKRQLHRERLAAANAKLTRDWAKTTEDWDTLTTEEMGYLG
ncbi:hypothetical protein PI126_g22694 [Phytophthora idaei]|nr:hypothetical protein PI126_g22694 [Phytophthora idaei]